MLNKIPRVIPDRDKWRNWYLDEDIELQLSNGDKLIINKGFRFDAHSVPFGFRWLFPQYTERDIIAALVHDYLIDTEPWHRYTRKFMDQQYDFFMQKYATCFRKKIMPKVVYIKGFLDKTLWGDYRGEPKPDTTVEVKITHQQSCTQTDT